MVHGRTATRQIGPPFDVEYQQFAADDLDRSEARALHEALDFIRLDSRAHEIEIERVAVKQHVSPEDESEEFVVTVWTANPPEDALDYWIALAGRFDQWAAMLARPLRKVARERIAIAVRSTSGT